MRIKQNIHSISTHVLEALSQPKVTDKEKAKIIAEGFAQVEKNYLNDDNLATKSDLREIKTDIEHTLTSDLRETELKLTKEIEHTRKEIETIRLETKNLEVKLIKEIENIRLETKNLEVKLTTDIKNLEVKLTTEMSQNSWKIIKWMIGLFIATMIPIINLLLIR